MYFLLHYIQESGRMAELSVNSVKGIRLINLANSLLYVSAEYLFYC